MMRIAQGIQVFFIDKIVSKFVTNGFRSSLLRFWLASSLTYLGISCVNNTKAFNLLSCDIKVLSLCFAFEESLLVVTQVEANIMNPCFASFFRNKRLWSSSFRAELFNEIPWTFNFLNWNEASFKKIFNSEMFRLKFKSFFQFSFAVLFA